MDQQTNIEHPIYVNTLLEPSGAKFLEVFGLTPKKLDFWEDFNYIRNVYMMRRKLLSEDYWYELVVRG